jgi:hypothetical protein
MNGLYGLEEYFKIFTTTKNNSGVAETERLKIRNDEEEFKQILL